MFAEERRRRILALLEDRSSLRVTELSRLLRASQMSVRRDLRELHRVGLLQRTHGGAVARQPAARDTSRGEPEDWYQPEKRAIGRAAARLVGEGETVFLDAGTTTLEIAREWRRQREIAVVTNGLNIARELASGSCDVTLTGGTLRADNLSMVGPVAEAAIAGLHVDKLFLGTAGVDLQNGLTTPNIVEAQTKRAMVESAREVIVVADRRKLGRVACRRFCPLERIHLLITDPGAPPEFVRALEDRGIKVLLADCAGGIQSSAPELKAKAVVAQGSR